MKITSKVVSLIVGISFLIAGIIALADFIKIPQIIGILLGVAALVQGLRVIWIYIRTEDKSAFRPNLILVWGILLILLAVFLFVSSNLASTIATYLVGAWFVADAVASFFTLKLLDQTTMKVSIVLNLLILAGGMVLILHKPLGIEILTIPISVTLILDGISIGLLAIMRRDPAIRQAEAAKVSEEAPRLEEKY
ncbi:MAG: hypothetical protein GXY99_02990 [Clostridiaceae bacterium]|jgi:uncharacterized membrane protein HdeD (DUF308 family)|nr:hypothetical protein [Clostridiaceae bacterium]HZJ91314.1 DUF308 domain-containing protein [Oscillospiraceae bacterium]